MLRQAKPWTIAAAALLAHAASWAQGHGANVKDMKFAAMPNLPACATAAVAQGDPGKGPSFILGKMKKNCAIPWHWHTPNESIILVSGEARVETKDGKPVTLTAGGFAMMPSKLIHRFTCIKACSLYVYSDAMFDIHYLTSSPP